MGNNIKSHIKRNRLSQLPEALRKEIADARHRIGWSQAKLGKSAGLPQMHVSGIETGKIVPRYDTLLDLVRLLGLDLVMVPRSLVPAVLALIRDYQRRDLKSDTNERENSPLISGNTKRQKGERRNDV